MKLLARYIGRARGQHRPRPAVLLPDTPTVAPAVEVHGTVATESTLDDLLGPWPVPEWVGAVVAQCFDDCPVCRKATAGVLTKDGWLCGEFANHPEASDG